MKPKSLIFKYVLLFGVIQLIIVSSGSLIISKFIGDQLLSERENQIAHTARILSASLAPLILVNDISSAQSLIDSTFKSVEEGELLALEVSDNKGRIIASSSIDGHQNGQEKTIVEPIRLGGIELGKMKITFSNSWLTNYVRRFALSLISFFAVSSAIATIGLLYFTLQTIVLPIKAIADRSEAIKKGTFDFVSKDRQGEIGELAAKLEEIARYIKRKEELIASYEKLKRWCQEAQVSKDEAATIELMKENFINLAAHELRTPLTIIKGNIEILKDEKFGLPKTAREKLDVILKRIDYLIAFVNDLTDLTLIGKRTFDTYLHKQKISLSEIAGEVADEYRLVAAQKKLSLKASNPPDLPLVSADPLRLRQVFSNLIDNAVKYATPESEINIAVFKENGNIISSIENKGKPIPPAELTRIFMPFYRSAQANGVKGLGLGLTIARGIIESHGGEIWVESDDDGTTCFKFSLPI